jgi:hypothetical protein
MYTDSLIDITDTDLVIKNYYFPLGNSKHILFNDIEKVQVLENSLFNGSFRLWGGGILAWLALDVLRPKRDAIFRVLVKNSAILAGFTAKSSADVVHALAEKGVEVEIHGR